MKQRIVTLSVVLCLAAAFGATGILANQDYQLAKSQMVAVTGCLVQGSGPTVFILENAKADPRDANEKGRNYLLVTEVASISFREHLNNEVRIDGAAELKMVPPMADGQEIKESDLPKLKASKVVHVATTCSTPLS